GAGNDARPRRSLAEIPRRRVVRCRDIRFRGGVHLEGLRGPRIRLHDERARRMARHPRRRRAPATEGLSEVEPVRARRGLALGANCMAGAINVFIVMPGLVPGIHVLLLSLSLKTWMAGTK